jgi:uncharacterized RmlC-like cupin family protein
MTGETCVKVPAVRFLYKGKRGQGLLYADGVSAETSGAKGLCLQQMTIEPGARGVAHLHRNRETAIYMISGDVDTYYGDNLEHHTVVRTGDYFYIPANVPHLAWNKSDNLAVCIVARTDPNERESVEVLPELDAALQRRMAQS